MLTIFITVLPVFLLIGTGYVAVRSGYLPLSMSQGLNAFAIKLAVPLLLFGAMVRLDFSAAFSPLLLVSFYSGAFICFVSGIVLARKVFGRRPGEAVAVGFAATFSNSVLLGLAVVERIYPEPVLTSAFGIIAFHAPSIYIVGMITMELMRRDGKPLSETLGTAGKSILANPLMIGILSGVLVNLSGLSLPEAVMDTVSLIAAAALPVALVGIGAAMTNYQLRAGMAESLTVSVLSLLLHPLIAFVLSHYVFALPADMVRAAVTLAAMPPGMNIYVFAVMYNRAVNLAASAFLMATTISVLSISAWLYLLSHMTL
ncbi:AEC family transporter [Granulosicoccaceae sp. 1_MG-2023]|nr:AEC family transporter [Granulosicoccaceae sp. 1_MG-2023]